MRWLGLAVVVVFACDSSDPAPVDGSTTAGEPSTSTTLVAPASSSSSSSSGEPQGFDPQFRMCRRECEFSADCCPADVEPCPSPEYPGNYGCEAGLCVPAVCSDDAQCNAQIAGASCELVEGLAQCVVLCEGDEACASLGSGFACGGLTGEGAGYCRERCDLGTPCLLDSCNPQGVCECSGDDECVNGFACDPA